MSCSKWKLNLHLLIQSLVLSFQASWFQRGLQRLFFFSLSMVSRSPPVRQHTSFFPNLPHAVDVTYSFCFLRIGMRAKGEPPERAKKRLLCSVHWRFGRAACDKDSMLIFTKNNVRAKIAIVIYCTEMINLRNGNEHVLNYEQAKSAWKNKGKIKFLDLK